jgi:hypothetical protein
LQHLLRSLIRTTWNNDQERGTRRGSLETLEEEDEAKAKLAIAGRSTGYSRPHRLKLDITPAIAGLAESTRPWP